jgi:signal transduction histidine kinase
MNLRPLFLLVALALPRAWGASSGPVPPGRVPLRVYGPKDGLTSLNPTCLTQDPEGFLWVGTQSGLYKFDGARFRKFGLQDGLPATDILALMVSADGSLWMGTGMRGLARYRQGRFEAIGPDQGLPQTGFRGFAEGAGGRIWVANREGLFWSRDGHRFTPVPGWPRGPALAVTAAGDGGGVWVSGSGSVHAFGPEGLLRTIAQPQGPEPTETRVMAVDGEGTLWIRTPQTLLSLPRGASRFRPHPGLLPPARTPNLHRDPSGALLATSNLGIHLLRGGGTPSVARFIKADSPYCSLVDQEGSLWIGTRPLSRALGEGAFEVYGTAEGLPSNLMWGIHRSPDGTLWVGTQSGACRATARGWEALPGTEGMNTRCILSSAEGDLWISQRNGPPLRYAPGSRRPVAYGPEAGFQAKGVYGMLLDRQGDLWLAQQEGGLGRGRRTDAGWRFESVPLPRGTPNEDLFGIAQDAKGRILVAGTHGLAVLDRGRWRRFTRQDGLRDDALYQLAVLPDGAIVVAYREGLGVSILRLGEDRLEVLRNLDKGTGLVGDNVYMLGVDASGRLWLGTGTGVSVLAGDVLDSFTTEDGLAGDDCDAWSFLAEPDGGVWIGSNTGLSHYRPPASPSHLPPLQSLIRDLTASGNPWPLGPPPRTDLPRDHNTLEFQVSALTFLNENRVEHQVRLLGLERDWQTLQGRSARYPALGPGPYTFQVRSRLRGGTWGPEASFSFRILPAWWERTWVRVMAWVLPLGLLAGATRWRFLMLRRRNAVLEARVAAATGEIRSKAETLERVNQRLTQLNEDKNQMLGIVAHDLRAPLHTIHLNAELLEGETDPNEVDGGSREIQRISGEMSDMIRRLLDLSHIEAGELDLQMGPVDSRLLAEAVVEQYLHKAGTKDIALEVVGDRGLPLVWADPFYLREALDNLVSNAVKFTPPGPPTRTIQVVLGPGILEVRDEGPGFTEGDMARAFGRFTRLSAQPTARESSTGLGLSIVKTIVEAMEGRIELESTEGSGSTLRIRLRGQPSFSRTEEVQQ